MMPKKDEIISSGEGVGIDIISISSFIIFLASLIKKKTLANIDGIVKKISVWDQVGSSWNRV